MPFIRLQNESLRLAFLDPDFNLEGSVVTAVCNFDPGCSLR